MIGRGMTRRAALIGSLLAIGCESGDSTGPTTDDRVLQPLLSVGAANATAVGPDGKETPLFSSRTAVPADWVAKTKFFTGSVSWFGSSAIGRTSVDWFGNRLEMTRTMSINDSDKPPLSSSAWKVWPVLWARHSPGEYQVSSSKDCGQTANMAVNVVVKLVALIKTPADLTTIDQTGVSNNWGKSQSACTEPTPRPVTGGGSYPGDDEDCPPDAITCGDCYEEWAWFEWVGNGWVQISNSWWEYICD